MVSRIGKLFQVDIT